MTHPRLTSVDGTQTAWLAEIGPLGSWGDLSWTTRYGDGPCGMFEASWTMPLPPNFDHPLLRRGTRVELMDASWRVGSTLILNEPARGTGYGDPWRFTASGVGREVEGSNSWYNIDFVGNASATPTTAITTSITRGLPWAGYDTATTPATPLTATPEMTTLGQLLSAFADAQDRRWGVGQDDIHRFYTDPTTPTYHVVPGAAALGVADDNYATAVWVRYSDSGAGGALATVASPAGASAVETRFGRREYAADLTNLGQIATSLAQDLADGILAKTKGRLGWANSLPLTSNELLTSGGVPADLSLVSEQVGDGLMVRLHGLYDDVLDTTYLDIIIGEARYADGADVIDLAPLGLVAVDFASVIEEVAGPTKRV